MFLLKKLLPARKIAIINIWTFKVKVTICEIKWDCFKVIWYSEKRQDKNNFEHWEISNISSVCESIKTTLQKACKWICSEPREIVINYPSSFCFPEINEINYKRQKISSTIQDDEFTKIIEKAEEFSLKKAQRDIFKKTGFSDIDQKLIYSSINEITLDWWRINNPIWERWENVKVNILNIFSSQSKFNIIKSIWKILNKKILFIIPNETAIPKISNLHKNSIFVDFWNSKTRIIISEWWKNIWFNILDIWIEHLISQISSKYWKTRQEVISWFDSDSFAEEKSIFLETWIEWVKIAIKDLNIGKVTPSEMVLSWWWWKNLFVQKTITSKSFWRNIWTNEEIKIINKEIKNSLPDLIKKNNIEINTFFSENINFNVLSQIIATKEMINTKNDIVIETLKKVLEKIRY